MPRARTGKLTRELMDKLYDARSKGAAIQMACDYVGINRRTYEMWIRRGNDEQARMEEFDYERPAPDEAIYYDFMCRMTQAKGECGVVHLENIEEHAKESAWQASKWLIERMYPNDYDAQRMGNGTAVSQPGEAGDEEDLEPHELQEIMRVLDEAGQLPEGLYETVFAEGEGGSSGSSGGSEAPA